MIYIWLALALLWLNSILYYLNQQISKSLHLPRQHRYHMPNSVAIASSEFGWEWTQLGIPICQDTLGAFDTKCSTKVRDNWFISVSIRFRGINTGIHNDGIKWKHFRVTGFLWGEFVGHRWILRTKASGVELWCFLFLHLDKRLNKQSRHQRFRTPSHPLWRHCNVHPVLYVQLVQIVDGSTRICSTWTDLLHYSNIRHVITTLQYQWVTIWVL